MAGKKQTVIKTPISPLAPAISPKEKIAFAVILLAALLVRIPGLTESIWFDEIWYTQTMFAVPSQLAQVLWKDVHPPTYALMLLAWTDVFGNSEMAVRMPSLLCGMASLALFWVIARRWTGPSQALLATALLALSPAHIWYSNENKVNLLLLLLCIYSVWLYWRASETRLRRDWIVATVVLIIALYTHAYAVPVAATIFLWLGWRAWGDRSLIRPLLVSGFVVAMFFAPLALFKFGQRDELVRGYLRQLSPVELYKLLLIWLPSGNTLRTVGTGSTFATLSAQPWPYFLIEAFFAFLLGRGLLVVGRRARGDGWLKPVTDTAMTEPARLMLLWIIMPLVFTVAGSLASKHFYIERNLLVILPPFLLVLVAGAEISTPRWARMTAITGLVILAIAATVSLRVFKTETWTVYKYKPDWRSAAYYLNDEIKANGTLRVLVTTNTFEFDYYRRLITAGHRPDGSKDAIFLAEVCFDTPENIVREVIRRDWPTIYLVHNKTWSGCWKRVWETFSVAPQLELVEQREFKGLSFNKFRVAGSNSH